MDQDQRHQDTRSREQCDAKEETEEKSTITCSAACSKNEGHLLETSIVKRENEHQSEVIAKAVVDLKRQLALSKFASIKCM